MKTLCPCLFLAAICLQAGFAAPTPEQIEARRQEIRAYEQQVLKMTGGSATKPSRGYIAIVNCCNADAKVLQDAARKLTSHLSCSVKVVDGEESVKDASLSIRVVKRQGQPPMIVAPEERWAEVNTAALCADLKSTEAISKFSSVRLRKLIMRAFAYAASAGGSGFRNNILDATTVKELDYRDEALPEEAVMLALDNLKKYGIEPSEKSTYFNACREGWAPQPTNEYQKAIWEKVHSIPDTPLKIEFDPAAQKGKVTR